MAKLLRCFCQGFKVCFEIVPMATDADHVKCGDTIIAIAGTGRRHGPRIGKNQGQVRFPASRSPR
ncbi:MAG: hypothetical protein WCK53_11865 [Methanomicrobiales archaeon]